MVSAFMPISTIQYQQASSPVIGMAVLNKTLESAELSGENMIKMMEQSVSPSLGSNIDLMA